jgi:hypothetical protein
VIGAGAIRLERRQAFGCIGTRHPVRLALTQGLSPTKANSR